MNQKYCHLQKQFYQQYSQISDVLEGQRIQAFFSLVRGLAGDSELKTNQWGVWTESGQYLMSCPEHGTYSLQVTDFDWYATMERTNTDEIVLHQFMTGQDIRHIAPCFDVYEYRLCGITMVLERQTVSACSDGLWINRPSPRYLYAAQTRAMLRSLSRYSSKYYGLRDWNSMNRKKIADNLSRMLGYNRLRLSNNIQPCGQEVNWLVDEINTATGEPLSGTVSSMLNDFAQTCCADAPLCGMCPIQEWCHYPDK